MSRAVQVGQVVPAGEVQLSDQLYNAETDAFEPITNIVRGRHGCFVRLETARQTLIVVVQSKHTVLRTEVV